MLNAQNSTEQIALSKVLTELESEHGIRFNYETKIIEEIFIKPIPDSISLEDALRFIESQTNLIITQINKGIYGIFKSITICGYLLDKESGFPLEDATISAESNFTTTNEKGYFSLKLLNSSNTITIRYVGYEELKLNIDDFSSNDCKRILIEERIQNIDQIILSGYLIKGIDKNIEGNLDINFSKFTLLPGLIEADILQTLQSLPGIHSTDETISNLSIRGGSHDQNLIQWDGIKMCQSGHFFGLISSFNPKITHKATFIQNGSDAYYTDGVSGTIELKTEEDVNQDFKGSVSLNFLSADAFLDVPISSKSSLQLAARKSINEFLQTPTYQSYFDRVTQETELLNNSGNNQISNQDFEFYDTSLRWLFNPTERDKLRFNFIYIDNKLSFEETNLFNLQQLTKTSSLSQNNLGFGFEYERVWNSKMSTEFQIYETDYDLKGINANVELDQLFLQENKVSETGIKLNMNWLHHESISSKFGYQFVETEITNLNDVDNPRFRILISDVLRTHSLYYQGKYASNDKNLFINLGGRINYLESFGVFIAEPRLSASKKMSSNLTLEIKGELKHQNSSQIVNFQNDFLGIEKRRWQLTDNDSIPILRSKQASIGLIHEKRGTLIDIKAYYKEIDGITTQSQGFTTKYEFTREKGSYNVYGIEFLLRQKLNRFNTWLSYSYMNNNYQFQNLTDSPFPSNFDITHSLNLGLTYSNEFLLFSGGFIYRTGNPTTMATGIDSTTSNLVFESANSSRLDDYLRLDASLLYKFKIGDGLRSEVGASVWNVLNRQNVINNYYRTDDVGTVNEFSRFSLGTTANFVARVFF